MRCCNLTRGFQLMPTDYRKVAGYGALITALALIALSGCLAAGLFTPGMQAHVANYSAAILAVLSIVPLAVSASLLCQLRAPSGTLEPL